jgi:hypothetical protein
MSSMTYLNMGTICCPTNVPEWRMSLDGLELCQDFPGWN